MTINRIFPYLNFDGNAAEVIAFYGDIFRVQKPEVTRFADMKDHPFGPEANDRVMHACLTIGKATLMLSDVPPGMRLQRGTTSNVMVDLDDLEETKRIFAALAKGGEVSMDLHQSFWGATFGMVVDRFGVSWMLSGPKDEAAAS